jgi:two-component system, NtrC family, sensor kinase
VLRLIRTRLRFKLLALVLLPGLLIVPAILGVAYYWSKSFSYNQLYSKVTSDLTMARETFRRMQLDHLAQLKQVAESYAFHVGLERRDLSTLRAQMERLLAHEHFDFVHVIDGQGRSLLDGGEQGFTSRFSPLRTRALQGEPASGVEVFSHADLLRESEALAQRGRVSLLETSGAGVEEDRGLVLRMLYPAKDARGRVIAVLDGGILLNHNHRFVDAIRDAVYGPGSLPEGSGGMVAIFLDDVRVTTNLLLPAGGRAVGARISREVKESVLAKGETWINRAFVADDWYISAYEPLYDVGGQTVGVLHAGFLEAPFRRAYAQALAALLVTFVCAMTLSGFLIVRGTKSIFRPLETMAAVVRATKQGEERRIGQAQPYRRGVGDEVAELAREFDAMLDLLQQRNREIAHAADQLELKVQERTRELAARNLELERLLELLLETRRQLVLSAKLAALGELTAGVAHEINNPTAVILGNIDLLTAELGELAAPVRDEIELVVQQVYRIRQITDSLLQYSRPPPSFENLPAVDVNLLLEETLVLVRHESARRCVEVHTQLHAKRPVRIARQELQQVLVNLLVNALQALPERGRLELRTDDWEEGGVVIRVRDNGGGISAQHLERVFDPFFTTKGHEGTGLGLYVSYGIVRRYGGHLEVDSELGRGSEFSVWLLETPRQIENEEALIRRQIKGKSVAVAGAASPK